MTTRYTISEQHAWYLRELFNRPLDQIAPEEVSDSGSDYFFRWLVVGEKDDDDNRTAFTTRYITPTGEWEDGTETLYLVGQDGEDFAEGSRLVAMFVGYDDDAKPWYMPIGSDGSGFWASITKRGKLVQGCWAYSWTEQIKLSACDWTDGPRSGSAGAWVEPEKTGDVGESGDGPGEEWTITVHDATSGEYKLTVDGTLTDWIEWNASVDDIRTALEGAGASLVDAISTLVFDDTGSHTIVWTASTLKPEAVNPALEANDEKASTGRKHRLFPGWKAKPELIITRNEEDEDYTVELKNVGSGTYALTIKVGGSTFNTSGFQWDADTTEIQDAIDTATGETDDPAVSAWTHTADGITYTLTPSDFATTTITGDGSNLVGNGNYVFEAGGTGSTGDGSPDSPPQVCVQVVTDVTWDADTCSPTVTYGYVLVTDGPFDDAISCGASPHV